MNGSFNVLQNCQGQFLSNFMLIDYGWEEDGGIESGGGVVVSGYSNTVRECTLSNTAGSGIFTDGTGTLITRNHIYNTDYSGTHACCLAVHGNRESITFNTAHDSGRDILKPEGAGSDIRFNEFYHSGVLCSDLGLIYNWGINGQDASGISTRIAYNWCHDNGNPGPRPLIYLDNYVRFFVIDHNVCWGGGSGVRINRPAFGDLIFNNTLFYCDDVGTIPSNQWPVDNPDPDFWTDDFYQYSASNNLFLASYPATQLVNWENRDFRLRPNAAAIDAGSVIPGFTEGYAGAAPDLGAYESGCPPWTAGVNSRPTLFISQTSRGKLKLISSPDAAFYQLLSTTNLMRAWNLITNIPVATPNSWIVTLSAADGTCYYRLQAR